jgi:hypothetical protein
MASAISHGTWNQSGFSRCDSKIEFFSWPEGSHMSLQSKKSACWTTVLIILGLTALYAGSNWLAILIPAALLVWYGAGPMLRSGRN